MPRAISGYWNSHRRRRAAIASAGLDQQEASGRLSRINGQGALETILEDLHFPTALLPLPDGSLYLTEAYAGRLLHIEFDAELNPPLRFPPVSKPAASYVEAR